MGAAREYYGADMTVAPSTSQVREVDLGRPVSLGPPMVAHRNPLRPAGALQPSFRIASFEGPLDLLLHLVRSQQIDIYEIPIARITEQYLEFMDRSPELDFAAAGEYVLMAATLIDLKARMLLPAPPAEEGEVEEDPRAALVERLLEYERYQQVVTTLRAWEEERRGLYFRGALEDAEDYALPVARGSVTPDELGRALERALERAGIADAQVTTFAPRKRFSLRVKMAEVLRITELAGAAGLTFDDLADGSVSRLDIVLAFLSLLELMRLGRIEASQAAPHGAIHMRYSGPEA